MDDVQDSELVPTLLVFVQIHVDAYILTLVLESVKEKVKSKKTGDLCGLPIDTASREAGSDSTSGKSSRFEHVDIPWFDRCGPQENTAAHSQNIVE